MPRLSRDELFVSIAETVAERSTCLRGHVGAVIVVEKHIVSMGYNGAPPGQPHCDEVGCGGGTIVNSDWREADISAGEEIFPNGCTRTTHAESNAVAFAARQGIPCAYGTMYCTHAMCHNCAAIVVAAGIKEVVYVRDYRAADLDLLEACGVQVRKFDPEYRMRGE